MLTLCRIAPQDRFWDHLGAILGPSWAILGHLGAILGPSWAIFGPSWDIVGNLGATLGHLGPILGKSWAHLEQILRPGLAECAQRLNPPPPVADRVARAYWITFRLCRLLRRRSLLGRSRVPPGLTLNVLVYPCTQGFFAPRHPKTPSRPSQDRPRPLQDAS